MKAKITAVLLASFVSAPAFAASAGTNYVGAQFARATYDESGLDDFNPTALVGRFGHYYSENFSLEARLGFGLSDDSLTFGDVGVDLEIDHLFGIYGVGHLPISDVASVYALAGFTQGEATVSASGPGGSLSESGDDTSFSYGVGAEFNVSPVAAVTLEYTSYLDKSDYQITAFGAGVNFKF